MVTGVAARVRLLVQVLATAIGVVVHVLPLSARVTVVAAHVLPLPVRVIAAPSRVDRLLHSVPKNDVRDQERVASDRPLVLAPVSAAMPVRNDPLANRSVLPLRNLPDDLHRVDCAAVPPVVVQVVAATGGRRVAADRPDADRLIGARLRDVEIGARKHEDISHRDRLADMDMPASAIVVLRAGALPLIAVIRTAEATASAIVDTPTARSMVPEVTATLAGALIAIAADIVVPVTPIRARRIAAVADMVTATLVGIAATVLTTLSDAVMAAASVMPATGIAATLRTVAASAITVMVVERSAIMAVAVLATLAIPDTVTAAAAVTLMRDSEAVDINHMAVGAT